MDAMAETNSGALKFGRLSKHVVFHSEAAGFDIVGTLSTCNPHDDSFMSLTWPVNSMDPGSFSCTSVVGADGCRTTNSGG